MGWRGPPAEAGFVFGNDDGACLFSIRGARRLGLDGLGVSWVTTCRHTRWGETNDDIFPRAGPCTSSNCCLAQLAS